MILKLLIDAILIIVTLGVLFVNVYDKEKDRFRFSFKALKALVPLALTVAVSGIVIIPANTVGVRYSAINGTSDKTLQEGIHYVIPFVDTVYTIDTTIQERTCEGITVQTKDAQFVTMVINIKYQVEKGDAFKVYKGYKTLDNLNTNLIKNAAQDALNDVYSKYNVIEAIGEKQPEIRRLVMTVLSETYASEGVTLKALTFEDVDAGDEIEKAITQEAVAKKEVETAEQQKQKAQIEADTKVIEAQGEADANAIKTKELTQEILTEKFIEKWDGKLPIVMGEDGNIMDISALMGQ